MSDVRDEALGKRLKALAEEYAFGPPHVSKTISEAHVRLSDLEDANDSFSLAFGEAQLRIEELQSALATARREADDLIELLRKTYGPIASIKLFNPDGDERYPQLHRELLHKIRDVIEGRALLSQSVEVGRAEPRGEYERGASEMRDKCLRLVRVPFGRIEDALGDFPHPLLGAGAAKCLSWIIKKIEALESVEDNNA